MKFFIFFISVFIATTACAQTCEKLDRNLLHFLPEVPDTINCKDSFGKKHGWWVYYKVLYNDNRYDTPEEDTGNHVQDYYYGKYKDGRKIGTWKKMNNVHLIYTIRTDSHFYNVDTLRVESLLASKQKSTRIYIGDSAIKAYNTIIPD